MRPLQVYFGLLCFIILVFIGLLLNLSNQNTSHSDINNSGRLQFLYNNETARGMGMENKCTRKTAVFFLKTHKCGSSTIQNILMRFGRHHSLSFVLPEIFNYVGNPEYFSPEMIGSKVRLPEGEKYDIFTHHTRYSHREIKSIMRDGAPFVTIMREPKALQISLYNYYKLELFYKLTLPHLLQKDLRAIHTYPRYWYRIGWNQIAWDLGVTTAEMNMPQTFLKLSNKVQKEFNLVMITEYMEASLVLFADLMCWPLEEVRFINVNVHYNDVNLTFTKPELTKKENTVLEKLNGVDIQLYSHFKQRFKQRILEYGAERMVSEVNRLIDMNLELFNDCVLKVIKPTKEEMPVITYALKFNAPPICKDLVLPELFFTDTLRREQEERIKITSKLKDFLYN